MGKNASNSWSGKNGPTRIILDSVQTSNCWWSWTHRKWAENNVGPKKTGKTSQEQARITQFFAVQKATESSTSQIEVEEIISPVLTGTQRTTEIGPIKGESSALTAEAAYEDYLNVLPVQFQPPPISKYDISNAFGRTLSDVEKKSFLDNLYVNFLNIRILK